MEYPGSQSRLSLGLGENLQEMLAAAGTAGGDDGDGYRLPYRIDQLKVEPGIGAVLVNTVE